MNQLISLGAAIGQLTYSQSVFAGYPLAGGPAILVVREFPVPDGMTVYFLEPNGVDDGILTWILPLNEVSAPLPFPSRYGTLQDYRTSKTKMAAVLRQNYKNFYNDLRRRELGIGR